jgi:hypothetical protein
MRQRSLKERLGYFLIEHVGVQQIKGVISPPLDPSL